MRKGGKKGKAKERKKEVRYEEEEKYCCLAANDTKQAKRAPLYTRSTPQPRTYT